ncbi:CocE/NonD family hydrolase [Kamptonema cortianum]|nr:CocE/NonD family hydrolase [Geitlerinema splendidum]MDK3162479.1 CocE/NonD family hydrolase [Kamptonema cortianum]
MRFRAFAALALFMCAALSLAQTAIEYTKYEYMIPMRDGIKLYTSVYVPKGIPGDHPILLERTPYGAGPYGPGNMRRGFRGSRKMAEAGYIFAYQDVRGKGMSEGDFVNLRPQLRPHFGQKGWEPMPHDIDESTDTYDTIEFLINNVPTNNKRVGMWGISYPGGYAALGAMSRHPALKAVSPQAPTADWFLGDDMHHNGAFFLQDFLTFFSGFGAVRPGPGQQGPTARFNINGDAYKFFLELGALSNVESKLYQGKIPYWQEIVYNDTYNDYWQARSVPSGLTDIKCAMLWVGGFFDAEDCWGPLACYQSAEAKNPGAVNHIIMGPWFHGMWAGQRGSGQNFHVFDWGSDTAATFQEIEFTFFDAFLRGNGTYSAPEAIMFDSGRNVFREFDKWPPRQARTVTFYPASRKALSMSPSSEVGVDEYVSDPSNPVPYQGGTLAGRTRTYMLDDQRFALERNDVLTYTTPVLENDITLAGTLNAVIRAQVSGTDCDFIVKLIDVHPQSAPGELSGFHMLVRGEVMRAKFRNSFVNPQPLDPTKIETVPFTLPDTMHTFKRGHRIMIQIQSSWFPLVDRNPHKFMNIFKAVDADFASARVKLHYGTENGTRLIAQSIN